ncbi:AbrB/MazE/SpoVT family DNA-binding domain-containing protein [Oenococcus sicerae]|uniref:AbrB/MazE/SpoVT family DNA-binding domain-containing protein n=1 Tax=Oenococcus sicerae TaxID=2203724 RepID=A0AAJ1REG1_9LACO|nr:AbrB/MazE/SpoVT family DNA-binding domain-containing protein [Oenococcus sicerae]MDN6900401.1 AbrB/MazE/SpoVT family DNA-binding domain-containing protein [Oenococcus sicerae]QAS69978.1 AbrB/MazE/SpoVT family DNA-binding domain-containing protein [Oenococcus sicerae]
MTANQQIHISIPKETLNRLSLTYGDELLARVDRDKIIIEPKKDRASSQTQSLRWFMVPGLLAGIVALINFMVQKTSHVHLSGANSISQITIYLAVFFGFMTFLIALFLLGQNQLVATNFWIKIRSVITLTTAFTILNFAITSFFFYFVDLAFHGVILDPYTSSALIAGFVGIASYLMMNAAQSISFSTIATVMIATLVGGIFLSMITNSQEDWWQINFSYLGSNLSNNWWQFNFTLIFSALVMLTLIDYIFSLLFQIKKFATRKMQILRALLVGTSIMFGLVGVFQNNRSIDWLHQLHWWSANLLVVFILAVIISLKWLLPNVTREFLLTAYGFAGLMVLSEILFQTVHYLSLTAFEIISFSLAFGWLVLLMQNLNNLYIENYEIFTIELK